MISRSDPARIGSKRGLGRARGQSRPTDGFTLIEMIVVLTVLALFLVLAVNNRAPVSPATHARSAAQAISAALRSARSEALKSNRSVTFALDLDRRIYRWGQAPPQQ